MRPPRSRSPPTRIYAQQQNSDVFTASPSLAQAIARSGRSGGEIINYRVNTSVSVLRFYIYFFRYTIRVTSGGLSRQSFVERIFFSLGLPPQFAFLSFHEAFSRHTSSTSFLPFHLSLIERRDHFSSDILTHTFVALRAPNEAPGPATQCSECGGVMREF